jgi:hypothetical protein
MRLAVLRIPDNAPLVRSVEIELTWAQGPEDFEGEKRGWRKPRETLRNLRLSLIFTEEIDNN